MTDTEMPGITINHGYIKLNTNYIPKFYEKEGKVISKIKITDKKQLNELCGSVHIINPIPLEIEIGRRKYILEKGEHYIPKCIHFYHTFKILTDIFSCKEEINVYADCIESDLYFHSFSKMSNHIVVTETIKSNFGEGKDNHVNERTVFYCGMAETLNINKLIDETNNKYSKHPDYIGKSVYVSWDGISERTCSTFLSGYDLEEIQKDIEVTSLLSDYDKGIRLSDPPCILIQFKESKIAELTDILDKKYDMALHGYSYCNEYRKKTYEEMAIELVKYNEEMDKIVEEGIFEFVTVKQIPFTVEYYNKIMNITK